jgi:hypothetical protein
LRHKSSFVLGREITDDESAILRESGRANGVFGTDELSASAEVTVTKIDFDGTESASLAEAMESAFKAVEKVPDLSVPCITVPLQDEDEFFDATAAEGEEPSIAE